MKTISIIFTVIILVSTLILTGCEPTDGQVKLKEPKKELSEMPQRKDWLTDQSLFLNESEETD